MESLISTHDIILVLFLAFLEGVLSVDNAVVLAMVARHLPAPLQKKALTYGLIGAVVFRLFSLALVSHLMKWTWVKFVGGGYLVFIAAKHFLTDDDDNGHKERGQGLGFWRTVVVIELMDIAFAVDSILAAVALSQKFWIVFTGGMIGVVMMRFAATLFLTLLKKYPSLETSAFLLILLIGLKLILEGFHFAWLDFHSSSSPAFWAFWMLMAGSLAIGFRKKAPRRAD